MTSQADFHAASPSEWQLACQREAVIRPLAEADRLSCLQVDRAANILGLGRSVTYRLIARFRQRPQTSSLLLAKAGRRLRALKLHLARGNPKRGNRLLVVNRWVARRARYPVPGAPLGC